MMRIFTKRRIYSQIQILVGFVAQGGPRRRLRLLGRHGSVGSREGGARGLPQVETPAQRPHGHTHAIQRLHVNAAWTYALHEYGACLLLLRLVLT